MTTSARFLALLLALTMLAACGGGDDSESTSEDSGGDGAQVETTLEAEQELSSALRNAAVAQESYYTENMTYASSLAELEAQGLNIDEGVTLTVSFTTADAYCLMAHHSTADLTYKYDSTVGDVEKEGAC